MRRLLLLGVLVGVILLLPLAAQAASDTPTKMLDSAKCGSCSCDCCYTCYTPSRNPHRWARCHQCHSYRCGSPCSRPSYHRCHRVRACHPCCSDWDTIDHQWTEVCTGDFKPDLPIHDGTQAEWDGYWESWTDAQQNLNDGDWLHRERWWYMSSVLDHMQDVANVLCLCPIADEIYVVGEEITYEACLGPGRYVVLASGGPMIGDLDIHVTADCGAVETWDEGPDAMASLWFCLSSSANVEITLVPADYCGGESYEYYAFMLAKD